MRAPLPADLAPLPLFGGLSEQMLDAFAKKAEVLELKTGQEVFHEGDAARAIYVVVAGRLEAVKQKGDGELVLSRMTAGECFGEMSFIDMQPRSATVRAVEPTTLWAWPYAVIHERYCSDSKCYTLFVMNIARELSRRLRRADEMLVTVPEMRATARGGS